MKAKSFQITALSTQLQKDFDVVLLYGTDEGELNHTFLQLKKLLNISGDSLNTTTFTKEMLKKTPFLATDEANTTSLVAERRFLFVPEDTSFSAAALNDFLARKKTNALLIILGGNLSKTNALRQEAEKNPRVLAIACYQPTLPDIQKNILSAFAQHHKKIAPPVLKKLCEKISLNQQVVYQELEKLFLYMGDKTEACDADIQAIISANADISLENICIHLADGHVEEVQKSIALFLASEESETTLFWAVRDYFERLLLILSDSSEPLTTVVKKHLKPAQFRLEIPLTRQARFWTIASIFRVLDKLTQLEQLTRQTGFSKDTLIEQTFLSLSLFAQKLSRLR